MEEGEENQKEEIVGSELTRGTGALTFLKTAEVH